MEIIQIISAIVVFIASSIPIYFASQVFRNKAVFFSSVLLFLALVTYGIGIVTELYTEHLGEFIIKFCLAAAVIGTMTSYIVLQRRRSRMLIGGMFGLVMLVSFGTLFIGETLEVFFPQVMVLKYLNSSTMIGFGIFIVFRYLWLRRELPLLKIR